MQSPGYALLVLLAPLPPCSTPRAAVPAALPSELLHPGADPPLLLLCPLPRSSWAWPDQDAGFPALPSPVGPAVPGKEAPRSSEPEALPPPCQAPGSWPAPGPQASLPPQAASGGPAQPAAPSPGVRTGSGGHGGRSGLHVQEGRQRGSGRAGGAAQAWGSQEGPLGSLSLQKPPVLLAKGLPGSAWRAPSMGRGSDIPRVGHRAEEVPSATACLGHGCRRGQAEPPPAGAGASGPAPGSAPAPLPAVPGAVDASSKPPPAINPLISLVVTKPGGCWGAGGCCLLCTACCLGSGAAVAGSRRGVGTGSRPGAVPASSLCQLLLLAPCHPEPAQLRFPSALCPPAPWPCSAHPCRPLPTAPDPIPSQAGPCSLPMTPLPPFPSTGLVRCMVQGGWGGGHQPALPPDRAGGMGKGILEPSPPPQQTLGLGRGVDSPCPAPVPGAGPGGSG